MDKKQKEREKMKRENTPELVTERLILRKFTEEDREALYEILKDEEVNRFLPWFPAASLDGGGNISEGTLSGQL